MSPSIRRYFGRTPCKTAGRPTAVTLPLQALTIHTIWRVDYPVFGSAIQKRTTLDVDPKSRYIIKNVKRKCKQYFKLSKMADSYIMPVINFIIIIHLSNVIMFSQFNLHFLGSSSFWVSSMFFLQAPRTNICGFFRCF